jgi:ethanolamine utilization protein EutP (predicted NTPase)
MMTETVIQGYLSMETTIDSRCPLCDKKLWFNAIINLSVDLDLYTCSECDVAFSELDFC